MHPALARLKLSVLDIRKDYPILLSNAFVRLSGEQLDELLEAAGAVLRLVQDDEIKITGAGEIEQTDLDKLFAELDTPDAIDPVDTMEPADEIEPTDYLLAIVMGLKAVLQTQRVIGSIAALNLSRTVSIPAAKSVGNIVMPAIAELDKLITRNEAEAGLDMDIELADWTHQLATSDLIAVRRCLALLDALAAWRGPGSGAAAISEAMNFSYLANPGKLGGMLPPPDTTWNLLMEDLEVMSKSNPSDAQTLTMTMAVAISAVVAYSKSPISKWLQKIVSLIREKIEGHGIDAG